MPTLATITPNDLITQALKKSGVLGVGQTASAEDTNDALLDLNMMIAEWRRQRWLIWHLLDVSKVSTGAQSYSVATGGDFNTPRPDRLEAAFVRQVVPSQPSPVDWPLTVLPAREDYNRIALKSIGTFPAYIFYDAAYPTGTVYPWPVPQTSIYEIHLSLKETISEFTSLATPIALPPEFLSGLLWNLAARLRPSYQVPPDPSITSLARTTLQVIRKANAQVPNLTMPDTLVNRGRYYGPSDRFY